jgi:hypothetical protein
MKGKFNAVKVRRKVSFRRVRTAVAAITLMVLAATGIGVVSASADGARAATARDVVGSWMVTVNRGPSVPPLQSLQTFTRGNGVVEISNGGATVRSPAHGAWERIGARKYATTTVFFRYDPSNGAYIGTLKLRRTLELSPHGQNFTAVSVAELRNPAGQVLPGSNTRRDLETAERINVEPIPDRP